MLFSHKTKSQQGSRFIRLPTEIRMMVLRLLLVHDGPLRSRKRYGEEPQTNLAPELRQFKRLIRERKEEAVCSYNISPEILATCQKVFGEGHPLLYSSNTLGLQICEGEFYREYGDIDRRWQCGCEVTNCRDCMFVYAMPDICTSTVIPATLKSSKMMELVKKFDKLQIDINNPDGTYDPSDVFWDDECPSVRRNLLHMNGMLQNKSVQVKFINPNRDLETKRTEQQLKELMLIRCKEFKVLNTNLSTSTVLTVTAVVTSSRPILDLYKMLENTKDYCMAVCTACVFSGGCNHDCYHEGLYDLSATAFDNDAEAFFELRAKILKSVNKEVRYINALRNDIRQENLALDESGLPIRIREEDDSSISDSLKVKEIAADEAVL